MPLTINFEDNSTGGVFSWNWDFGDGVTSTLQNPTHTYPDTGLYNVSLIVIGEQGIDTILLLNLIHVNAPKPKANFSANNTSGV